MSGELNRYLTSNAADRQRSRELDAVDHRAHLAELEVAGIGYVSKRAMFETMQANMLRREAERLAPDGAELYAMIAVASAVEMTNVISRMTRPGRR